VVPCTFSFGGLPYSRV